MEKLTLNPMVLRNMSVAETQELVKTFANKNKIDKSQMKIDFNIPPKPKRKKRRFHLFSIIIILLIFSPIALAGNKEVDRFNSGALTSWSGSGIIASQDQIAAPDDPSTTTYYSLKITGNGTATYTYADPGDDWLTPGYDDLGFFVYGDNDGNTETLTVVITEYDGLPGGGPPSDDPDVYTWPKAAASPYSIDWTGWRYIRIDIDDTANDTDVSGTGNGTWDPDVVQGGAAHLRRRGVKTIEFTVSNNAGGDIYIDEIYASGDGDWMGVDLIHPTDDVNNVDIDRVVDRFPPTISAIIYGAISGTASLTYTEIDIVSETNPRQRLNLTTENDLQKGVFATSTTFPSSGTFTVFVWPNINNPSLNLGQAEVIRFKVTPPSTKIKTLYHREKTD